MRAWDLKDVERLRNLYPYLAAKSVAKIMGKSESSIFHKANRLQIKKDDKALFQIKSKAMQGKNSGNFKGYRRKTGRGYIALFKPDHKNSSKKGVILEHRYVMSQHIGRPLKEDERVHHINGNKKDNRIENLELMTHGEHSRLHHKGTKQTMQTKIKISKKAKERLKDKRNHPCYKNVDVDKMNEEINNGSTVKKTCKKYGIHKTTYYRKMKEVKL